jgi:hypothetical protein
VRSHARKFAALERQRRENPIQGRLKDHHRLIPKAPSPAHIRPLLIKKVVEHGSAELKELDTGKRKVLGSYQSADSKAADSSNSWLDLQHSVKKTITSSSDFLMVVQERDDDDGVLVCLSPIRVRHFESQARGQSSPFTILGAGRVDPFQSYPIKAEPYMHQLVDHCKFSNFVQFQLGDFYRDHC